MNERYEAVIIGAGLTGLTVGRYLKKSNTSFLILEKKERPGGVIHTTQSNGFLYEEGPNTGVLGHPEVLELFDDLEGMCELETANENVNRRLILKDGKWNALPSGLFSAVSTPLFTLGDKFRILGEPFRKAGTDPHETLSDFVKRRMGKSFLDYAIDPFILGVYAGDPEILVPKYALPKLYNLEQTYGSLIKGTIKKAKQPKTEREKRATRKVFSVKGGLSRLIDALYKSITKEHFEFEVCDLAVRKNPQGGFIVSYSSGNGQKEVHANRVITTTGGYEIGKFIDFIEPDDLLRISSLLYTNVVEVIVGHNKWKGMKLNAFGGLIPHNEKRDVLGFMFLSSLFENRAPEGGALTTLFMGGVRRQDIFEMNESELISIVEREFKELTGVPVFNPDLIKIIKHRYAIPQYSYDSGARFETIEKLENMHKGLILAGNIRNGIGMADRIKQGREIADWVTGDKEI